jgi:hypothetical protein
MPFRVLTGVVAAAVVLRHRLAHDLGTRRLGAREVRVRVGDDAVDAHGDAASGAWAHQQLAVVGLLGRAEHYHAVAERELGMLDGAALAFVDRHLLEAEGPAEKRDRRRRVLVLQGGNDGCGRLFGDGHGRSFRMDGKRAARPATGLPPRRFCPTLAPQEATPDLAPAHGPTGTRGNRNAGPRLSATSIPAEAAP